MSWMDYLNGEPIAVEDDPLAPPKQGDWMAYLGPEESIMPKVVAMDVQGAAGNYASAFEDANWATRNIGAPIIAAGRSMLSTAARPVAPRYADALTYTNMAQGQGLAEVDDGSITGELTRGVVQSLAQSLPYTPLGPAAPVAMALSAGATRSNEAYTEARLEGLDPDSATNYAARQGAYEAGITLVAPHALRKMFPRLGAVAGGVEDDIVKAVTDSASHSMRGAAKQVALRGAVETPEELAILFAQSVDNAYSGVNATRYMNEDGSFNPEALGKDIGMTIAQSMLAGSTVGAGVEAAGAASRASQRATDTQTALQNRTQPRQGPMAADTGMVPRPDGEVDPRETFYADEVVEDEVAPPPPPTEAERTLALELTPQNAPLAPEDAPGDAQTAPEGAVDGRDPAIARVAGSNPELEPLYAMDAGIKEGGTIEAHTATVLGNLRNEVNDGHRTILKEAGVANPDQFLEDVAALHDIGKGAARAEGGSQHQRTVPVLQSTLRNMGYTDKEVAIATALVDNDTVGQLIRGRTDIKAADTEIRKNAKRAGISPEQYLSLLTSLYKADAGAYPALRANVFEAGSDGRLKIKAVSFGMLEESVYGQAVDNPWFGRLGQGNRGGAESGGSGADRGGLFHGAGARFDKADPSKDSGRNYVGKAVYAVVGDIEVAAHYARRAVASILHPKLWSKKVRWRIAQASKDVLIRNRDNFIRKAKELRAAGKEHHAQSYDAAIQIFNGLIDAGNTGVVMRAEFTPKRTLDIGAADTGGRVLSKSERDEILAAVPKERQAAARAATKGVQRGVQFYSALAKAMGGQDAANKVLQAAGYDSVMFVHPKGGFSRPYIVLAAFDFDAVQMRGIDEISEAMQPPAKPTKAPTEKLATPKPAKQSTPTPTESSSNPLQLDAKPTEKPTSDWQEQWREELRKERQEARRYEQSVLADTRQASEMTEGEFVQRENVKSIVAIDRIIESATDAHDDDIFKPVLSAMETILGFNYRGDLHKREDFHDAFYRIGVRRWKGLSERDILSEGNIKTLTRAIINAHAYRNGLDPDGIMGHYSGLTDQGKQALVEGAKQRARAILEDAAAQLSEVRSEDSASAIWQAAQRPALPEPTINPGEFDADTLALVRNAASPSREAFAKALGADAVRKGRRFANADARRAAWEQAQATKPEAVAADDAVPATIGAYTVTAQEDVNGNTFYELDGPEDAAQFDTLAEARAWVEAQGGDTAEGLATRIKSEVADDTFYILKNTPDAELAASVGEALGAGPLSMPVSDIRRALDMAEQKIEEGFKKTKGWAKDEYSDTALATESQQPDNQGKKEGDAGYIEYDGFPRQHTGKKVKAAGAEWNEFVWLDGPKKGQTGVAATPEYKAQRAKEQQESWRREQEGFRRLHESKSQPPKTLTGSAEDDARLKKLQDKAHKYGPLTGPEGMLLKLYEARAKADPSKWAPGDGVGYRVGSKQINRGFRIDKIDATEKRARVVLVADTGLTSTGGNYDRFKPTWVHIADLVRDKKHNAPPSDLPATLRAINPKKGVKKSVAASKFSDAEQRELADMGIEMREAASGNMVYRMADLLDAKATLQRKGLWGEDVAEDGAKKKGRKAKPSSPDYGMPFNADGDTERSRVQKSADIKGGIGVVAEGVLPRRGDKVRIPESATEQEVADAVASANPEAERRIRQARGLRPETLKDRIKRTFRRAAMKFRSNEFIPQRAAEFAEARELFRLIKDVNTISTDEAGRTVGAILDRLGPKQMKIFERKVLLDNLDASVARGEPLRFGYTSLEEIRADKARVDAIAAANPEVMASLRDRIAIAKEVVDEQVEAGLLPEEAKERTETYYHQQVHEKMLEMRAARMMGARPKKRSYQKGRTKGPEAFDESLDYNTNYVEAELRWLTDAMIEHRKKVWLDKLAAQYDAMNEIKTKAKKAGVKWNEVFNKEYATTHAEWQPQPGNFFYRATTLPEKITERILQDGMADVSAEDLRSAMAVGGKRRIMILPREIVEQLESMQKAPNEGTTANLMREALKLWKIRTLLGPDRVIGYSLRNLTGDLDALIGGAPGALKHSKQAISELKDYYSEKKLSLSSNLRAARDLGVIGSGITAKDVPDYRDLAMFRRFYGDAEARGIGAIPARYFDTVSKYNQFRESIARYAAFLHYKEQLANGTLTHYGASRKVNVDRIHQSLGLDAAAAHMARNLMGDYGNLTVFGDAMRRGYYPFWSWVEINIKRYPQLLANAARTGNRRDTAKAGAITGARMTATALAQLGTWYALTHAWNWLMFPEEEKELAEYERATPHIILGRKADGSTRILRGASALGDFLEWAGINSLVNVSGRIADGQIDKGDAAQIMAKDSVNKVAQGLNPFVMGAIQAATGQSYFPDVFNPSISDRGEQIAQTFGLRDAYRAAKGAVMKDGTRARAGYADRLLGLSHPGRNALSAIYSLRDDFDPRPRGAYASNPYWKNIREAAADQNPEAFGEAYRKWVAENPGARSGWDPFFAALAGLDPLHGMSEADKWTFENKFLSGDDKIKLQTARDYQAELRERLRQYWLDEVRK